MPDARCPLPNDGRCSTQVIPKTLRVRQSPIVTETALRVRHFAIVTGTAKTASGLTKTGAGLTALPPQCPLPNAQLPIINYLVRGAGEGNKA
ncbi:hypothetical protein [Tolypothrix sp. VBCCA 56010]|uniref:hypothetical protein n=1 Tax=Tolypothrix sp. VBCCA 56010 TaxID=3137731 RepID=UPI003D7DF91A